MVKGSNPAPLLTFLSKGTVYMKSVESAGAPAAIGPYSPAILENGFLFASGQTPLDPATGELVEGGIAEQTERVMENLKAVLEAAGSDFSKVVKATCFLTDMDDFVAFNEVYGRYLSDPKPARSCIGVAALPKGARVEVELIATP